MRNPKVYWAAESNPQDVVDAVTERRGERMQRADASGFAARSRSLIRAYYGISPSGTRAAFLSSGGEQGEVISYSHNAIRPLITNTLGLIAGQRPGLKAVAVNTDSMALSDAMLADSLRTYTEKQHGIPNLELDCVRGGLIAGAWGIILDWERTNGAEISVNPETGRVNYEGDIVLRSVPWWDYAYDYTRNHRDKRWVLFRRKANKYELAADYPSKAEKILEYGSKSESDSYAQKINARMSINDTELSAIFDGTCSEDEVWLWEFRHKKTAALPLGRLMRFVDRDCVLFDSQNYEGKAVQTPYSELHAYEYSPERIIGMADGHTGHFDLLAAQHLMDVATSSIATSLNINSIPMIWTETGSDLVASQMSSGPKIISSTRKPESIDLPAFKPDVANVISLFQQLMRDSAAINEVVAGAPSKGMPAQAMALLRAQAVQYHQVAQSEYFTLVESVATGVLQLYKDFATTRRVSEIAGSASDYQVREWTAENLKGFTRFVHEAVNPMMQSYEGRLSMAENLMSKGEMSTRGFLTMVQTGTYKEPLEAPEAQLIMIQKHKELLREGIGLPPLDEAKMAQQQQAMQQALATASQLGEMPPPMSMQPIFKDDGKPHVILLRNDPHWNAYPEYLSVLSSPEARRNPQVVTAVLDVLTETLRLWASLTPDEIAAVGGRPLPSSMMPPMPPQASEMGPPGDEGQPQAGNEPRLPKPPKDEGQPVSPENLNLPPQ